MKIVAAILIVWGFAFYFNHPEVREDYRCERERWEQVCEPEEDTLPQKN